MKKYVPAEWVKQKAVWLTWPCNDNWWKDSAIQSKLAFAKMVATISKFERVCINCSQSQIDSTLDFILTNSDAVAENLEFVPMDTNDVWCRDSGGIFRLSKDSDEVDVLDFQYNSWGGKFPPWNLDDAIASNMAKHLGLNSVRVPLTCEGGGLEFDGEGTLMTTECVVLNENRNKISKKDAEDILSKYCGVENFIWLKDGLFNDDTDGHIDNIARFAPNGKIITAVCDANNPSYAQLQENLSILKSAKSTKGHSYEIVELPVPTQPIYAKYYDGSNRRLPASYANYLVVNNAVIVPIYNQESDENALSIIGKCFPNRQIIGLDCSTFLLEGGAVHCLTQQQPI